MIRHKVTQIQFKNENKKVCKIDFCMYQSCKIKNPYYIDISFSYCYTVII